MGSHAATGLSFKTHNHYVLAWILGFLGAWDEEDEHMLWGATLQQVSCYYEIMFWLGYRVCGGVG